LIHNVAEQQVSLAVDYRVKLSCGVARHSFEIASRGPTKQGG
jgi:hypothetical protein